jgi:hypothetical protein
MGSSLTRTRFSIPQYIQGELLEIEYSSTGQNACEIRKIELRMQPIARR